MLKRNYIAHKIEPIAGYADLERAGETMVQPMRIQQGGSGGVVVCLGVGGLVDMSHTLGLDLADADGDPSGGIEVWLIDARRPWNLGNVFAGDPVEVVLKESGGDVQSRRTEVHNGQIQPSYRPGTGGIIVYDDGDIDEDLAAEREAYCGLNEMPDLEELGDDSGDDSDVLASSGEQRMSKKRKSWSDQEDADDSEDGISRPRQRRRSSLVSGRMKLYRLWLTYFAEWFDILFSQSPITAVSVTSIAAYFTTERPPTNNKITSQRS